MSHSNPLRHRGRRITAALLLACSLCAAASWARPRLRVRLTADPVPVHLSLSPSSVAGGSSVTCTVEVDQVPAGGGSVQVTVDNGSVLHPPSGSWTYSLSFPSGGGTSASFTISSSTVSTNTYVRVIAARNGVDISNASNWDAVATELVLGSSNP